VTGAAVVALAALAVGGGCDLAISLPKEPESIVEALCLCEDEVPLFPEEEGSCKDYVTSRLALDPSLTDAWIDRFGEQKCDSCDKSGACTSVAPLCREVGETCSPLRNDTCCGFDPADPEAVYCFTAVDGSSSCIARNPECLPTGTQCSPDEEGACCGGCLTPNPQALFGQCVDVCQVDNDIACPGCCARIESGGVTSGVCIDVTFGQLDYCATLSCTDEDGCPIGTACVPHLIAEGADPSEDVILFYCSAPVGN
jgi:hypothetical protein